MAHKEEKYGDLPVYLGEYDINCTEYMFYQYLPIKLEGQDKVYLESRLTFLTDIMRAVRKDFTIALNGDWSAHYIYLTIKYMWQQPGCSFNRPGYHSDGFLTDDINYIWYSSCPTVFNMGPFNLTLDDKLSLVEMEEQAREDGEVSYPTRSLLRLNQYNIHKVDEITSPHLRTFLKVSISKDKYNLKGNSHNYLLDYNWDMKERGIERNIPQQLEKEMSML